MSTNLVITSASSVEFSSAIIVEPGVVMTFVAPLQSTYCKV